MHSHWPRALVGGEARGTSNAFPNDQQGYQTRALVGQEQTDQPSLPEGANAIIAVDKTSCAFHRTPKAGDKPGIGIDPGHARAAKNGHDLIETVQADSTHVDKDAPGALRKKRSDTGTAFSIGPLTRAHYLVALEDVT